MALKIVGFSKTSLLDWDGHVVATIYLQGCNWRCLYCHNPDLVPIEPTYDELDFEEIAEYIRANSDFLDGVAISGGEPTIHPDLPILIAKIQGPGHEGEAGHERFQPGDAGGPARFRDAGLCGNGHQGPVEREVQGDHQGQRRPGGGQTLHPAC